MSRDSGLDQGFAQECERLSGMEALWDPGSQALLGYLRIGPGLEVPRNRRRRVDRHRGCDWSAFRFDDDV